MDKFVDCGHSSSAFFKVVDCVVVLVMLDETVVTNIDEGVKGDKRRFCFWENGKREGENGKKEKSLKKHFVNYY